MKHKPLSWQLYEPFNHQSSANNAFDLLTHSARLGKGYSKGFYVLGYTLDDPVFSSSHSSTHFILQDMILLENQIPLFILDLLFYLQHGRPDQYGVLAKLALRFFSSLRPTDCPFNCLGRARLEFDLLPLEGELHCLELFWRSLLYPGSKPIATHRIKFRNREVESFQNIQFKDGTLEIPRLVILDTTRSLFLNLVAFEQCHFNCGNDITMYLFCMDYLIDSTKNVRHLHDYGILRHGLRSNAEVTDFFNQICKEVALVDSRGYLSDLTKDDDTYSGNKWNGWIAILKLKYFSNPWSIISLIIAFIFLLLTLTQIVYGVFGY
ncbi:hypothetical protein EUGRSUZ_L00654 [Eucalyptus grandis]|uniref:Uncharacterized protein n=1 Tax=Eucalyptus grandis TaxID=71139 RepID=A0A058ZVU9_EUCGR|nr:hypothetical protein EUGRSUZ_L00654 [Eucalyptus grandis]